MRNRQIHIDTSKLYEGMVVRNYREMCALLGGEEQKVGDAKTYQLNRWSRYFDWEKDGQKFIVTEIYDKPLPELLPNSAVYARFMQLTLMDFLSKRPDGCYQFFTMPLMDLVGMIRPEYANLKRGQENLEEMFGVYGDVDNMISSIGAEQAFRISYNKLMRILDDALKSLSKHAIIHFRREWAVKITPWALKGGFRSATKEEEAVIVKAESYALEQIGTTNLWYAKASRGRELQKHISYYLHEQYPDLYGAAKWISIVYGKPSRTYWDRVVGKIVGELKQYDTSKEMTELTDQMLVEMSRKALNKIVVDAVMHEADKEVARVKSRLDEEKEWGTQIRYNRDEAIYLTDPDFMREFALLVNRYIRIKDCAAPGTQEVTCAKKQTNSCIQGTV